LCWIPLSHFEFQFYSWQQHLMANSDRLSHFGRRISLLQPTLTVRGILFRAQEHRQEHMNWGAGGAVNG
jgi:hypothetical protein